MCLTTAKTIRLLIGTTELLYVKCLIRGNRCDGLRTHLICTPMDSGGHSIRQNEYSNAHAQLCCTHSMMCN